MTHPASIRCMYQLAAPAPAFPTGNGSDHRPGSIVDIGAIVARTFDLLEGTCLQPFATEVARGLVDDARRRRR